jgi:integrase
VGSIYKRGRRWWIAYIDLRGKQRCESSGSENKTDAIRMLRDKEGDLVKGVPVTPETSRYTFEDAIAAVKANYAAKGRRSLPDLERRITKHLQPHFGGMRLAAVTTDVIDRFVAERRKADASNGEINRELAIIKRAFSLAKKARKIHSSPHIEMLPEAAPRAGFFEYADFVKVRDGLPEEVQPLVEFCFITGWRWKSEVRPLEWSQVDFRAGTVAIPAGRTKGGEPRVFYLTSGLRELLQERRKQTEALEKRTGKPCPLVFHREGQPIQWFYGSWRTACEQANAPGRLLHDFRRTAIRNLVRAGISEAVAMKMCGHQTRAVFDRYNITDERDLRAAARLLDEHHSKMARSVGRKRRRMQ